MLQKAERTVTTIMPSGILLPPEERKIRIAPYCRVSTDSEEQEHSFAAQLQHYTELVKTEPEWELVDIYADEGISGRSTGKREEFNRLINDCKKGKIDRIITKSVSRFARNTVDCLQNVRLLASYGVSVYFEKEDIDTSKMSNEVLLAISGMQAQQESISHGNNMRWSIEKRMQKGEFIGTYAAYGFTLVDCATATIDESQAKVIRWMRDLYLSGWGFQRIANYFNEIGIKRPNGKKWDGKAVKYILTNERNVGDVLLQKNITTNEYPPRRMRNDGSQRQYYVENCLPAIFSREDRQAILDLLDSRKKGPYNSGGHKLSKLLYCNECGHTFRRMVRKNEVVWICNYYSSRNGCESNIVVNEDDTLRMFINVVNKLYLNRESLVVPILQRFEKMKSKINGTEMKIKAVDLEIAKLCKQTYVLNELIKNGILDTEDFYSQKNEISTRLNDLRNKRRTYLNEKNNDEVLTSLYNLNDELESMNGTLTDFDEDIIRAIVKKAKVISSTEIKIELHCGLVLTEHLPYYHSVRRRSA